VCVCVKEREFARARACVYVYVCVCVCVCVSACEGICTYMYLPKCPGLLPTADCAGCDRGPSESNMKITQEIINKCILTADCAVCKVYT